MEPQDEPENTMKTKKPTLFVDPHYSDGPLSPKRTTSRTMTRDERWCRLERMAADQTRRLTDIVNRAS